MNNNYRWNITTRKLKKLIKTYSLILSFDLDLDFDWIILVKWKI